MDFPWIIRIALADAAALARFRLTPGLEVAVAGEDVWLRGSAAGEAMARELAMLPARDRFERRPDGLLRRLDQRIPSTTEPVVAWVPLSRWLEVELPAVAAPARRPDRMVPRLVPGGDEQPADAMITSLSQFAEFVETAALLRLAPLTFAASDAGSVLVRGRPLPPVPGQHLVAHGSLLVPAGWTWEPRVAPAVLIRCFGVAPGGLVVWHPDGAITHLHPDQFLPVSRSAVRMTRAAREVTL